MAPEYKTDASHYVSTVVARMASQRATNVTLASLIRVLNAGDRSWFRCRVSACSSRSRSVLLPRSSLLQPRRLIHTEDSIIVAQIDGFRGQWILSHRTASNSEEPGSRTGLEIRPVYDERHRNNAPWAKVYLPNGGHKDIRVEGGYMQESGAVQCNPPEGGRGWHLVEFDRRSRHDARLFSSRRRIEDATTRCLAPTFRL